MRKETTRDQLLDIYHKGGRNFADLDFRGENFSDLLFNGNKETLYFTRCDFRYVNMMNNWTNVRFAYCRFAGSRWGFSDTDMTAFVEPVGLIDLGSDRRGYSFVAVAHEEGWRIYAGCRDLTISQAMEHWRGRVNFDALARVNIVSVAPAAPSYFKGGAHDRDFG